jgi:hypothetical protein
VYLCGEKRLLLEAEERGPAELPDDFCVSS